MSSSISPFTDSHAHLAELTPKELIAAVSGVSGVVNVAVDLQSSKTVISQCSLTATPLYCAVGVAIPSITKVDIDTWSSELELLITGSDSVVAIGETGVDLANTSYPPYALQEVFFREHLRLAEKYDLPVIVHSRGAEDKALEICKEYPCAQVVFHCYTGSENLVSDIMDAGYYISLSGIVTFKNSKLEEVARAIHSNRLLLETDSPYLAPVPLRGTQNCPNNVDLVGQKVAELREISSQQLATEVAQNFQTLFSVSLSYQ